MKVRVTILLVLVVIILVPYAYAGCRTKPRGRSSCRDRRDEGHDNGRACFMNARIMWYFDARRRTCRQMNYRGCGGNNNRFCIQRDCVRRCLSA